MSKTNWNWELFLERLMFSIDGLLPASEPVLEVEEHDHTPASAYPARYIQERRADGVVERTTV